MNKKGTFVDKHGKVKIIFDFPPIYKKNTENKDCFCIESIPKMFKESLPENESLLKLDKNLSLKK